MPKPHPLVAPSFLRTIGFLLDTGRGREEEEGAGFMENLLGARNLTYGICF